MDRSILRHQILPAVLTLTGLVAGTIAGDAVLHALELTWLELWLGVAGTALVLLSFLYSARKRALLHRGGFRAYLRWHELAAWAGTLMVLVHAGVHFTAALPWLAVVAMLANVVSGVTGKVLLDRGHDQLAARRAVYRQRGLSEPEIDRAVMRDAVALEVMGDWRAVHLPMTVAFLALAAGHIGSVLMMWEIV
jgi:hypothetical protein